MSDTPLTDAQRPQNMGVSRDFARRLERAMREHKEEART